MKGVAWDGVGAPQLESAKKATELISEVSPCKTIRESGLPINEAFPKGYVRIFCRNSHIIIVVALRLCLYLSLCNLSGGVCNCNTLVMKLL